MKIMEKIAAFLIIAVLTAGAFAGCKKSDESDPVQGPLLPPSAQSTSGPSMTLNPSSGLAGASVTVTGTGFAPNIFGGVFFDTNGNGAYDPNEPLQQVTTSPSGAFTLSLVVPAALAPKPGAYSVRAAFALSTGQASATFTVTAATPAVPTIMLSPAGGPAGTSFAVTGSGFTANTYGAVLFDTNGNGAYDPGEPLQPVTASASGAFTATLSVPSTAAVTPGMYTIKAGFALNAAQASTQFAVVAAAAAATAAPGTTSSTTTSGPTVRPPSPTPAQSITLSTSSGRPGSTLSITGSGLPPSTLGGVFLDLNGSDSFNSGEPFQSVTTSASGTFSITFTVPSTVPPGPCIVAAAFPLSSMQATRTFTVTAP